MDNEVLAKIVEGIKNDLMGAYGFCGVAESGESAFLNSSDGNGNDIKIKISIAPE